MCGVSRLGSGFCRRTARHGEDAVHSLADTHWLELSRLVPICTIGGENILDLFVRRRMGLMAECEMERLEEVGEYGFVLPRMPCLLPNEDGVD